MKINLVDDAMITGFSLGFGVTVSLGFLTV